MALALPANKIDICAVLVATGNTISEHPVRLAPPTARCGPGATPKDFAEVALVLKPQLVSDFLDGQIACDQQLLRFFDNEPVVINVRAHAADRVLEELNESRCAGPQVGAQLGQAEFAFAARVHIF